MSSRITDIGVEKKSERLQGKKIGLGVCGGIGAVEIVRITRELRRHGASVFAFFTPSVERFITRLSVEWATNNTVVTEAGAHVEYLDSFDLVLVAPATLSTISKSALAITDNVVSLLIANQVSRQAPLLFVPAMNRALFEHPLYSEYQARLKKWGAQFLEKSLEEERLKMPEPVEITETVIGMLNGR